MGGGGANPPTVAETSTVGTQEGVGEVVKREEKLKGPVVVSSAPAAVLCKSTMAKEKKKKGGEKKSVLYTERGCQGRQRLKG